MAIPYDPEAGFDMPSTVIGEIHTPYGRVPVGCRGSVARGLHGRRLGHEKLLRAVIETFADLEAAE